MSSNSRMYIRCPNCGGEFLGGPDRTFKEWKDHLPECEVRRGGRK